MEKPGGVEIDGGEDGDGLRGESRVKDIKRHLNNKRSVKIHV